MESVNCKKRMPMVPKGTTMSKALHVAPLDPKPTPTKQQHGHVNRVKQHDHRKVVTKVVPNQEEEVKVVSIQDSSEESEHRVMEAL